MFPIKYLSLRFFSYKKDFKDLGGSALLKLHDFSLYQVLSFVYSEHEWLPWQFDKCPHHFWSDSNKKMQFIETISKELKINDWYKVNKENIRTIKGGDSLLKSYNGSIYNIVVDIFPEKKWIPWKFSREHFSDPKTWRLFLDSVAKQLNIKEMKDWYSVKEEVIK